VSRRAGDGTALHGSVQRASSPSPSRNPYPRCAHTARRRAPRVASSCRPSPRPLPQPPIALRAYCTTQRRKPSPRRLPQLIPALRTRRPHPVPAATPIRAARIPLSPDPQEVANTPCATRIRAARIPQAAAAPGGAVAACGRRGRLPRPLSALRMPQTQYRKPSPIRLPQLVAALRGQRTGAARCALSRPDSVPAATHIRAAWMATATAASRQCAREPDAVSRRAGGVQRCAHRVPAATHPRCADTARPRGANRQGSGSRREPSPRRPSSVPRVAPEPSGTRAAMFLRCTGSAREVSLCRTKQPSVHARGHRGAGGFTQRTARPAEARARCGEWIQGVVPL
jgi:hypothetical protein